MFKPLPTYYDEHGNFIQFLPIIGGNVPGFSHRVTLNHHLIGYLSDHKRPSAAVADFFFSKHGHKSPLRHTGRKPAGQEVIEASDGEALYTEASHSLD